MKVAFPFRERFREPMLAGTKILTSRTKKYGEAGDTFEAFGATFKIDSVVKHPLWFIADNWKFEGCSSYEDFMDEWKSIHPNRKLDLDEEFWVHKFHLIKEMKKIE